MTLDANLWFAALSGFAGALVMSAFFYILTAVGIRADIPFFIGSHFAPPEQKSKVYGIGMLLHLMIGALWGMLYLLLMMGMAQPPTLPLSLLFGFGHGIFAGILLSTVADRHPRVGPEQILPDPGMFGHNWHRALPYLIVAGHIIYGLVTILVYNQLYHPVDIPEL